MLHSVNAIRKASDTMKHHLFYAKYLARHKWFVFVAGLRIGVPLWRLIVHDWSKLLPCEWIPYANYFYGEHRAEFAARFSRAWLHHQHSNPHHWQHWILRNDNGSIDYIEMPENFVREMVADWYGAARAITGKWEAEKWYEKNWQSISTHPGTALRVLEIFSESRQRFAA